jgi:tripartite-type tricarboxylate transporter receptor subunit TctC
MAVNLMRDLVPVAGISRLPMAMVVHPSVPAKTVPEFIAYANLTSPTGRDFFDFRGV